MATPVEVPKVGNTVEECIVAKWLKQKGDVVSAGDVIAEIESDKATFDLTAPVDGTILELFFDEGAIVPVFTNLFVIGEPGESVETFRPQSAGMAAAPERPAAPIVSRPTEPAAATTTSAPFSPRARRFAEQHGFHPSTVAGSGPGGRVIEEDLRRAYNLDPPGTRISSVRERIARRMRESLASTAQYTLHASADATGLLALRARFKASAGPADININSLVTFCTVKALLQIPDMNVEFIDGRIHKHPEINIGFAVDTPRGLLVPVVRNAHALTIGELASKMKELTAQAAQGTISPDGLLGATFSISNLGALGIGSFTPVLNPPQVAILGVGAIEVKPVRREGKVEFIDGMALSLTCDHQVIDGAPGARFLQVLIEKIEKVESLCTIP